MLELYYLKEADSVCSNRAVITLIEKGIEDWIPRYIHLLDEDQFDAKVPRAQPESGRADGWFTMAIRSANHRSSVTTSTSSNRIRR